MNVSKKYVLRLLAFIVFPLFVVGCSYKNNEEIKTTEEISLNSGAVLKNEEGSYKLYDYKDGKYELKDNNTMIVAYDKVTSSYICIEDEKHYIVHSGHKIEINDKDYNEIKISPKGKYVSYFIEDEGLRLKVINAEKNKEVKLNSHVSLSGNLYDWYDENTLVYYGIDSNGVNGIFTYNLDENKEELLYKLEEGFLGFLKNSKDGIIFLQIDLENTKELRIINKQTKDVKLLANNIELIFDLIVANGKTYFTGKIINDKESLYQINNNSTVKRLVYDFPNSIKEKQGLSVDEYGNVLFIGYKDTTKDESIYKCSEDGTISLTSKPSKEYIFLQYRS